MRRKYYSTRCHLVEVSEEDYEIIARLAQRKGISMNDACREIVEAYGAYLVRVFNRKTGANCRTLDELNRYMVDHPETQGALKGELGVRWDAG